MRCGKCGFSFQGMNGTVRGKPYPRYVDGGWKAKRACSYTSIRKEDLESFVLEGVAQAMEEAEIYGRLEHHVTEMLASKTVVIQDDLETARREHLNVCRKVQNLLSLAEDGIADNASLRERLRALDGMRIDLERRIERAERERSPDTVVQASALVREFIHGFRARFDAAPHELQKLILQKCLAGIVVDPDEKIVHVYVRKIPAVSAGIEKAFNSLESKAFVDTTACARNRT
jgi:hypothetical protein